MAEPQFVATVRHDPSHALAVIEMSGDMNVLAKGALEDAYTTAVESNPARILLNFGRVEYINSSGIALIVSFLARARSEHRAVSACGLNEHYLEIFEITRLTDYISVFGDEESASLGFSVDAPHDRGQDASLT